MAIDVAVYQIESNKRSRMIASAMHEGAGKAGLHSRIFNASSFRSPVARIAVFYGFDSQLQTVFQEHRRLGLTAICVDLGYWGRREGGPLEGYHKVVVNGRHPTQYFQARAHESSRFEHFRVPIEKYRSGRHIVVAGMSGKGAEVEGFAPEQWERETVEALRGLTDRPIIYRPKPSWVEATPIPGTRFEPGLDDLDLVLDGCHAVVTHHSNVAIDGLLKGIPAFAMGGAGSVLALSDIGQIESPWCPERREQFAADLAWTQFRPSEMRSGMVWRFLTEEGLL